jgi:anti-sigma regulatory factor (Ser/Thr protein kinase)
MKPPDIDEKIEGKDETRGWGMFLIKSLMNEVEVESKPEGGNEVRMVILLEK